MSAAQRFSSLAACLILGCAGCAADDPKPSSGDAGEAGTGAAASGGRGGNSSVSTGGAGRTGAAGRAGAGVAGRVGEDDSGVASDAGTDAAANAGDSGVTEPGPGCTSCGGCPETLPVLSRNHVTGPIEYPDPPPAGGDHDPCWAKWGVHTDTVPTRNWVHNLEHGGVVFLFNCPDGCDTDLAMFTALAKANQRTLLTASAELRTRFALVAWGHRLLSDCIDTAAFQAFYAANFDHGPESISSDPASSCPF